MRTRNLVLAIAIVVLANSSVRPQKPAVSPSSDPDAAAAKYFTDVSLVDQNAQTHHLFTDLMKDHVVIVNAFLSTCTATCPPVMQTIRRMQTELGDKLGQQVRVLSITTDPSSDTTAKLLGYSQTLKAKSGWYFLTGDKTNVDLALRKFGLYAAQHGDTPTLLIMGNVKTGLWKKAYALSAPLQLMSIVESLINDTKP